MKWQGVEEKERERERGTFVLQPTTMPAMARVALSNDSQAGAQWVAVYRAFIIPPSK